MQLFLCDASCLGLLIVLLGIPSCRSSSFFFFNDTATTEIYTLSLHDALPISNLTKHFLLFSPPNVAMASRSLLRLPARSEEHTSELQSQSNLVCRLLLEKKKTKRQRHAHTTIRYGRDR